MNKKNIQDIYPLSPMQQGMLFHSLLEPNSGAYIVQINYELHGQLNIAAFTQAWQKLIDRHSILRTAFVWDNLKQPLQVVGKTAKLSLIEHDWQHLETSEQQEKLANFLQAQKTTAFNLNKAPLMRLNLIKRRAQVYQFIWTYHHLLLDGWSIPLLIKELLVFYQSQAQNKNISLAPATPYKNYITWLQQQDQDKALNFWRKQLENFNYPTSLGIVDRHNKHKFTESNYQEENLQLSTEITNKLNTLAEKNKLTLSTIVQGAWAILLHRYSNENDIVFGVTSANRSTSLVNSPSGIGLFINTLPVRVKLKYQETLIDLLEQLQSQRIARQEYEFTSLIDIHRVSNVPKDLPLFQSIVVFENYPIESTLKQSLDTLNIRNLKISEQTNYPLTLYAAVDNKLSLKLLYNSQLFNLQSITNILQHLQTLLLEIVNNPQQKVGRVNILTSSEKEQLLTKIFTTATEYPQDYCFHQLFVDRVVETPNAIAAIYEEEKITYQELDRQADSIANYLQELGVKPETKIGICLDRSLEMLVGLLAIQKAGGVYIPLDPHYPQERLDYIVEDSQIEILLTQTEYRQRFVAKNLIVVEVRSQNCLTISLSPTAPSASSAPSPSSPENLAYVIYTSGSTGKPKGVQITHRSLVNFLYAMKDIWEVSAKDTLLSVTTISFDIAALELYLPLLVGGTVVIAPKEIAIDSQELAKRIDRYNVTIMQATPATWKILTASNWNGSKQLKILSGGEALEPQLAERLITKGKEVSNLYGPTETTIWSSVYRLKHDPSLDSNTVPIGKAIANTQFYILDSHLNIVPPGIPGELYIGGAGLARGYLNRGDLTAERFIPNPFTVNSNQLSVNSFSPPASSASSASPASSSRLYKTGDRVRYLPDGNIEYLGRLDNQVKIRGFRVELGEIETILQQHPEVETAIVSLQTETVTKKLVAYILPKQISSASIDSTKLRSFLQEKLPHYMIPTNYVMLTKLPLTPNGKIERASLPKIDTITTNTNISARKPQTEIERSIAQVWQQILQVDRVSTEDNFFDLGGHSLLMIQVHSKLKETLSSDINLIDMFRYPTITSLANYCTQVAELNSKTNLDRQQEDTKTKNALSLGKNRLRQRLKKRIREN